LPVLFCRALKLVRRTPLMGEWAHNRIAPRRVILSAMFQRELRCTRAVWKTRQDRAL